MDKKFQIRRIINQRPLCDITKFKLLEDGEGFKMDYLDTVACQIAKWVNDKEMEFVCSQIQKYIEDNGINVCFVMNEDELKDCLQQHNKLKLKIFELESKLERKEQEIKELKTQMTKKKKPYEKFMPCVCGHNRRSIMYDFIWWKYQCMNCGLKSYGVSKKSRLKRAWNKMITDIKETEMKDGKGNN